MTEGVRKGERMKGEPNGGARKPCALKRFRHQWVLSVLRPLRPTLAMPKRRGRATLVCCGLLMACPSRQVSIDVWNKPPMLAASYSVPGQGVRQTFARQGHGGGNSSDSPGLHIHSGKFVRNGKPIATRRPRKSCKEV